MTKRITRILRNLYARITEPLVIALLKAKPLSEMYLPESERLSVFAAKLATVSNGPTPRVYLLDDVSPNMATLNWDSDRPILLMSYGVLSFFDSDENGYVDDSITHVIAKLLSHDNRMEIGLLR